MPLLEFTIHGFKAASAEKRVSYASRNVGTVDDASQRGSASGSSSGGRGSTLTSAVPAILAVIAFAVSVVLLIWVGKRFRARYHRRRFQMEAEHEWKPALSEVALASHARECSLLWRDVQPLSAEYIRAETATSRRTSCTHVRDSYSPSLLKIRRISSADSANSRLGREGGRSKLAVGFMIAMPHEKRNAETAVLQSDLCLGLTEVPWDLDCHG